MTVPAYSYAYPRPALTVDAMILHYVKEDIRLLLIRRKEDPYKDFWAFPGGFINENETVERAIARELKEETGLDVEDLEQIYTASAPGRDPRGWTLSVVFVGFLKGTEISPVAGDDAAEARWHALNHLPDLAFDHEDIVKTILKTLKRRLASGEFLEKLLPGTFSKEEFLSLYRALLPAGEDYSALFERLVGIKRIISIGQSDHYQLNTGIIP